MTPHAPDPSERAGEAAREVLDHIPESSWRVAGWVPKGDWLSVSVDIADRKRLVTEIAGLVGVQTGEARRGSWVCGRCGGAPEQHATSNCVYDPAFLADRMAARAGEVAEADIEAVLAAHSFDGQRGGRQECRCRWRAEDTGSTRHRRHVAEMIAASGLVGGRADEARAEAWDEGYAACFDDSRYEPGYGRGNPYRGGEAS